MTEKRYDDAAYYYWLLALEHLKFVTNAHDELTDEDVSYLAKFEELKQKSEIYYSFRHIAKFIDEPFTSLQADSLFHISRYLVNLLGKEHYYGISRVYILYTLGKQAKNLEAYKVRIL